MSNITMLTRFTKPKFLVRNIRNFNNFSNEKSDNFKELERLKKMQYCYKFLMTVNAFSFVASSVILNKMDMFLWFGLCHYITYTEHEEIEDKIKEIEDEINNKKKVN